MQQQVPLPGPQRTREELSTKAVRTRQHFLCAHSAAAWAHDGAQESGEMGPEGEAGHVPRVCEW